MTLTLDPVLLHSVCRLLQAAVKKSDWDMELKLPGVEPQDAPERERWALQEPAMGKRRRKATCAAQVAGRGGVHRKAWESPAHWQTVSADEDGGGRPEREAVQHEGRSGGTPQDALLPGCHKADVSPRTGRILRLAEYVHIRNHPELRHERRAKGLIKGLLGIGSPT